MPVGKPPTRTPARKRAAKKTSSRPIGNGKSRPATVVKHVRFGGESWDKAQERAAGEGRQLPEVLRNFVIDYGNGR